MSAASALRHTVRYSRATAPLRPRSAPLAAKETEQVSVADHAAAASPQEHDAEPAASDTLLSVRCPHCGMLLFRTSARGYVEIKCRRAECRRVVHFDLAPDPPTSTPPGQRAQPAPASVSPPTRLPANHCGTATETG